MLKRIFWMIAPLLITTPLARGQDLKTPQFPFSADEAREYQREFAKHFSLPLEVKDRLGNEYVLIPAGKFVMGSPADELGRKGDETRHEVTITHAIYLAKRETTRGQFAQFVKAKDYKTDVERNGGGHAHDAQAVWEHRPGTHWQNPGFAGEYTGRDDHPVVHVSHADIDAYRAWLNQKPLRIEGTRLQSRFRLPTEAEWEWSCRAGSGDRFWWGDKEDASGKVANVGDRRLKKVHPEWPRSIMAMDDGHAFVAPVGSYTPNAFGLHDMLGNVWEFCATRHGPYPKEPSEDPGDLGKEESYSVRGGGWSNVAADCRCATRNADPPHFGHSNLGFRLAIELEAVLP